MDDLVNSQPSGEFPQPSDRYVTMENNNHALLTSFFPDESPLVTAPTRQEFSAAEGVEVLNSVIRIIAKKANPNTKSDQSPGSL